MINPYTFYALSFSFALLIYPLGWSDMFPSLTVGLVLFMSVTILLHLLFSLWFRKRRFIEYRPVADLSRQTAISVTMFIYLLWISEFVYAGGIPLVKILLKQPFDYRIFGIPSLHVFAVTFSSFFAIYLFHNYIATRNVTMLILFLVNMLAALLIYNRGMLLFNIAGCFFVYCLSVKRFKPVFWFSVPFTILVGMYFFGVMGTLRVSGEARSRYDNYHFLETAQASQSFRNSLVPDEFLWTYIYVCSPLANLQQNINTNSEYKMTVSSALRLINHEMIMDFISKRIGRLKGVDRAGENTIGGPFNVSTVYSRSFSYTGWWGIFLMAGVVLLLPVLYLKILPVGSPYFITGFAILSTMFLFMAFDNTIRFTGLSFQLVYPVLFTYLGRFVSPAKPAVTGKAIN